MAKKPHISAIICEYNPFHNGHAYHIKKTRQNGATHILAIMSGNFVQRGEAALLSKWARTEMALRCGVDLVLELPLPFAIASAETFAFGAVYLADALGCVDSLSFGSECGDIGKLQAAANAVLDSRVLNKTKILLKEGGSFAAARQKAVEALFSDSFTSLLQSPNNIVGIEYCKAVQRLSVSVQHMIIK